MMMRLIIAISVIFCFFAYLRKTQASSIVPTTEKYIKKGSELEKYKSGVGKCECAIFDNVLQQKSPILAQSLRNATCTIRGEVSCSRLCSRLVNANEDRSPKIICMLMKNTNKFEASIFSRICNAPSWSYTGLTLPNYICCHEHKVIGCHNNLHFRNRTSH